MKWFVFRAALFGAMLAGLVSCGTEHLVSDAEERRVMLEDFERRRADVPRGEVFDFDLLPMSDLEREAMKFLYAYMPMSDVVDYDPEFFLRNVRASFVAREEMPWGERVPEREFRHFVLPVRVNNEDVDSARWVFYGELKDRVRGLSMRDAVLEVNHWCHEKVVYTPADPRTSSPLATMRTAYLPLR